MAHVMGGVMWALQSNMTRAFNASAQVGNLNAASVGGTSSVLSSAASPTTRCVLRPPARGRHLTTTLAVLRQTRLKLGPFIR